MIVHPCQSFTVREASPEMSQVLSFSSSVTVKNSGRLWWTVKQKHYKSNQMDMQINSSNYFVVHTKIIQESFLESHASHLTAVQFDGLQQWTSLWVEWILAVIFLP